MVYYQSDQNFYPWHSWIARQTPTLKVNGSNPFGQAKKSCTRVRDFFIIKVEKEKALCYNKRQKGGASDVFI